MSAHPVLTEAERLECGLITLCCDTCRATAGLLPLHPQAIANHTYYYCPSCCCQWIVDRAPFRMHPVDAFFGVTWLVLMVAMMFGIIYLIMVDGMARYGHDYLNNGHVIAALGVGCLCWLVLAIVGARVYSLALTGLALAARAVWDAVRPVGRPA
jgi:hypothetical protein